MGNTINIGCCPKEPQLPTNLADCLKASTIHVGSTTASDEINRLDADVQHWWSTEIEPYKALILGPHEARLVDAMSPVDQWSYRKYRYDVHFYYKNAPPPP